MNLDVETSSPSGKRSRNATKSYRGKFQKQVPTEEDDMGAEAEEEEDDEEEERGGQQNRLGEDDTAGGTMETKRSSTLWQTQQASRIFRVSRASGGKDRHSKVLTAKGLRDRRVRLSVSTAIQFYDLQDRLGYDQPSKAVDWLIKAASDAISDLPSLDGTFSNPAGFLPEPDTSQHPPPLSAATNLNRSACSSTSETSRGSLLSLSRSETRVKARERARERTKDKEKVAVAGAPDDHRQDHQPSQTTRLLQNHHQPRNSSSSFTELLMDCNNQLLQNHNQGFLYKAQNKFAMVVKKVEPPSLPNNDYFPQNAAAAAVSGFNSGQVPPLMSKMNVMALAPAHFANATQLMGIAPLNGLGFVDHHHHPELQQFSFSQQEHQAIPNSNDYNQNFSASSFSADSNRGTLQSNSVVLSPLHHLQKLSSTLASAGGGSAPSGLPFFVGTDPTSTGTAEGQYPPPVFDARLQLCYNDGSRQSTDIKGKGKG